MRKSPVGCVIVPVGNWNTLSKPHAKQAPSACDRRLLDYSCRRGQPVAGWPESRSEVAEKRQEGCVVWLNSGHRWMQNQGHVLFVKETQQMRIWLDADGCPNDVKDCVFRASMRTQIQVMLVADRWVRLPSHPYLQMIVVNQGFNAADDYIADNATSDDLVVTDDIPLAHRCVSKQVSTVSRRGVEFDAGNIGERLATRDLMEGLRGAGMITGGPASYSPVDKKKFAETFDRMLTRLMLKSKKNYPT